jgi:hypothetical protein
MYTKGERCRAVAGGTCAILCLAMQPSVHRPHAPRPTHTCSGPAIGRVRSVVWCAQGPLAKAFLQGMLTRRRRFSGRWATGRASLVFLGTLLSVVLVALAGNERPGAARSAELEEFVLEPIGPAPGVRQMALVQAYHNSMLW